MLHLRDTVSAQVGLCNGHFYGMIKNKEIDEHDATRISNKLLGLEKTSRGPYVITTSMEGSVV